MLPSSQQTSRVGPALESTLLTLAVLGAVMLLLSVISFVPRGSSDDGSLVELVGPGTGSFGGDLAFEDEFDGDGSSGVGGSQVVRRGGGGGAGTAGRGGDAGPGAGDMTGPGGPGQGPEGSGPGAGGPGNGAPVDCAAGQNGGNTDTGVTQGSVLLGASTVEDGPGASFLGPMRKAMEAVAAKVNASGGICGRRLQLSMHDSAWKAERGLQIIQNLVEGEKVFALAVMPDSEGLSLATENGYLERTGVPVVGTDGLLISQYTSDYIWPVATPTASAMYAIAKSQCDAGLRDFSIVFETEYKFGREGAKAYNLAAKQCTGRNIKDYYNPDSGQNRCSRGTAFCGILADQPSYSTVAPNFCADSTKCTAGALLLEPVTAHRWIVDGGWNPEHYNSLNTPGALGAPQPLFTRSFATACKRLCDGLRLWTGFKPPLEQFASEPGVQLYQNEIQAYDPNVDVNNQFVEGGYLGMKLVVHAMEKASSMPGGLTRNNVIAVLDNTSNWDIGLTVRPLTWKRGNHFAQASAHAFDINYGETGFAGWEYAGVVVSDPNPRAIL